MRSEKRLTARVPRKIAPTTAITTGSGTLCSIASTST
jgi:hypothetical protein